ncbi:2,3-dihydro-2,3-dihydroxybenzoate dehydrogenase [Actinopolyspora lacussalsi]|nr:2,3-dihydro-2,3-dihydroxybenzoate dehydrogenase [Actinopolyspora lacussalsi]
MHHGVALVTGAAGGIGAAVAQELSLRGVRVAALDRDGERLRETVEKLTAEGLPVTAFPSDVTGTSEVRSTVDEVEGSLGAIEHLVNAAGVLRTGRVTELSDEDWECAFAVNAGGVFRLSREVVDRMIPRGSGSIVTVASNAAATPRAEMAAYAASKAAATMFTKSLGLEVARHGIRCNIVAPGSTDTPMLRSMWHDSSGADSTIEGRPEVFRVGIPLGKLGATKDVAEAVGFLLSDSASQITMHTLTVDGGAALGASW